MTNINQSEKSEIIELALQESVGGGKINWCGVSCSIFSINVCDIDFCRIILAN